MSSAHLTLGTRYRRPDRERSVTEQSVVLGGNQVSAISEQVPDPTMEPKKSLCLTNRFEALHLSLPSPGMLM